MRRAAVAGRFYPRHTDELRGTIGGYFEDIEKRGGREGGDGERGSRRKALSAVSPHAGYPYSGEVAAISLSSLKDVDTYVIAGPSHHAAGSAVSLSKDEWRTPMGRVETDEEISNRLTGIGVYDEKAHRREHSIEVQLPILQYLFEDFQITPICLSIQEKDMIEEIASELSDMVEEGEKEIAFIGSSDFTHYQPQRVAERQDKRAIRLITSLDLDGFYDLVRGENLSICGYGPIGIAIKIAEEMGLEGELLEYRTSGDSTGDRSQVVGYAAICFE